MTEAGPSNPRPSGGGDGKTKQKKKHWLATSGGRGGGGGRGGRGRGGGGRGGSRGGARPAGGPNWMQENGERVITHLGRYREDPPLEMMTGPGILVMAIQNKERSAEKELVLHLEDVADALYPETSEGKDGGAEGEGDFEDMLQKELEGMGEQNKSTRFKLCLHDTMCLFYVNVLPPLDPVRLVHHILTSIEASGQSPFKYIARIVPISVVAGATLPQLSTAAKEVVAPGFASSDDAHLKFAVQTWSRKTDRLDRLDMIRKVAEEVEALGKGHTVDLKNPDRTVIVEVFKNSIGLAVLQDFDRFKKYNPGAVAAAAAKRIHGLPSSLTKSPDPAAAEPTAAVATAEEPVTPSQAPEIPMSPPTNSGKLRDPPSSGKLPKHYHRKLNAAMASAEYEVAQNMSKRKAEESPVEKEQVDEAMEEIIEDGKVYKLART